MKNKSWYGRHHASIGLKLSVLAAVVAVAAISGPSLQAAEGQKKPGLIGISLESAEGLPASALENLRAAGVESPWPAVDAGDSVAVKLWDEWPQPRGGAPSGISMSNGSTATATVTINGVAQ